MLVIGVSHYREVWPKWCPLREISGAMVSRVFWMFRISPEYSGDIRGYLGVRGCSLGSGYSKLQNQFELSGSEVRRAIRPNIPNAPSNISRIFGDIQLNGSPNLQI